MQVWLKRAIDVTDQIRLLKYALAKSKRENTQRAKFNAVRLRHLFVRLPVEEHHFKAVRFKKTLDICFKG
jgi:hypothetical protein